MTQVDLDVIENRDGKFVDHRLRFGYPPGIIEAAERAAQEALGMLRRGDPPFDGSHEPWWRRARDR